MAIFKALTFDGVNSLDYGIYITGEAVYNAPERAVEMVNIPGKNGALALDQGRFENIEVTYHAGCFADSQADFADKVMKFRNALASRYTYKRLTDEYHPDEYRLGLYKSGLDVDAVRYGTAGEFNIVFDCKPQRFLTDGDREILPTEWTDLHTVTGDMVTVESDGSDSAKSLSVALDPIQDLNGYDAPWVGGAGKNLCKLYEWVGTNSGVQFNYTENGVTLNGTATQSTDVPSSGDVPQNGVFTLKAGTYKPSTDNPNVGIQIVGLNPTEVLSRNGNAFTLASDRSVFARASTYSGRVYDNLTVHLQLEAGSTTTAIEPYENICPISGRTKVVTSVAGKNLLPMTLASLKAVNTSATWSGNTYTRNGITFTVLTDASDNVTGIRADGTATAETTFYQVYNTKLPLASGQYVINGCPSGGSDTTYRMQLRNGQAWLGETGSGRTFTYDADTTDTDLVRIDILSGATCNNVVFKPMIRLASDTDSTYEPYNGNTYTTSLGRTVYGGTLDVVSGVLTVDRALATLDGTEAWYLSNGGMRAYCQSSIFADAKPNTGNTSLVGLTSNQFVEKTPNNTWDGGVNNIGISLDADKQFCVCKTGQKNMVVADWKAYLTSNPLQVCYPLATPQTYQLTPQQIDLLLGTNHLWSDGEITVEYGVHPYYNPTPFDAKPLIKVTGRGTLGIGEYILTITGTASQTLYIDCETMEIYTLEGTVPTGASSLVSINKNDFPVLEPGTNYISVGSGITAVTITPRWWRI